MTAQAADSSPCTCVSRIVKLDPDLRQRRESLFASSQAQTIIEQMTGVSCNGLVILSKTPETGGDVCPANSPEMEEPSEARESPSTDAAVPAKKAAAPREKHSLANVVKKAVKPKLYQLDRTERAIKKWRTFYQREMIGDGEETDIDQTETKDTSSSTSNQVPDKDKVCDKDTTGSSAAAPQGSTPLDDASTTPSQAQADAIVNDDSQDTETNQSRTLISGQPSTESPKSPTVSPKFTRPARARFGRRYSMPVAVISAPPLPSTPAGSPKHASPRISRESSPSRTQSPSPTSPFLTGKISKLHSNREKLSTLFTERSAIISSLERGKKDGIESKVMTARLCRRRASDTTESLAEFRQQQRNKSSVTGNAKLLQRRGSVSHTLQGPTTESPGKPLVPTSSNDSTNSSHQVGKMEYKSRSCENVSAQKYQTPRPPAGFNSRRRGSVCVGQIARAAEVPQSGTAVSPDKVPQPGGKRVEEEEDKADNHNGDTTSPDDAKFQRPSNRYLTQRRASVSTAQLSRTRELLREQKASDVKTSGLSKSVPLTRENIDAHNFLTPFSLQLFNERLTSATSLSRDKSKSEDHTKTAGKSTESQASAVGVTSSTGKSELTKETGVDINDNETESPRQDNQQQHETITSPNPPASSALGSSTEQRRSSLFLRTDKEIMEDVEQEILERVSRRRRELRAVRCVSAKGAQRLEARALIQSPAGRLKRNLHEVTKQRKTKELIQIEDERKRLMKQVLLIS